MSNWLVEIDYTNWRGERRKRIVRPRELVFASNQYHNEPQWLLNAVDVNTGKLKTFAMVNVHAWVIPKPVADDGTDGTRHGEETQGVDVERSTPAGERG